MQIAWFGNLDADVELGQEHAALDVSQVERFAEALPELAVDRKIPLAGPIPQLGADFLGQAWCPTLRARRALQKSGVRVPRMPAVDVIARVNHRQFATDLAPPLEGARYTTTVEDAIATIQPTAEQWLLKRPFGFCGRDRRAVRTSDVRELDRRFITDSIARFGGLQIEPLVDRIRDFGLHGWLDRSGEFQLGHVCEQQCNPSGTWLGTRRLEPKDSPSVQGSLIATARRCAEALAKESYFGPFGIDGFTWRDQNGETQLHPLCDLNARYSCGWFIGLGERWRELLTDVDPGISH